MIGGDFPLLFPPAPPPETEPNQPSKNPPHGNAEIWAKEKGISLLSCLTTTTFITAGQTPVNLAKAAAAGDRQERPLIITVTAKGELFVIDHSITDEQLDATFLTHPHESLVLVHAASNSWVLPAWSPRSVRGAPLSRTIVADREEK